MRNLLKPRTLVLGGIAAVALAGALKNRHRVAGLIGARSSEPEPYTPPRYEPQPAPPVSNYDAPGPPANTATPVPAPEPVVREEHGIDEAAEEAAAAAEAANIGGPEPVYPSTDDISLDADDQERPVVEAGDPQEEGALLAEADIIENAEPAAGDPVQGELAVDEAIEEAANPLAGETLEPLPPSSDPLTADEQVPLDSGPVDVGPRDPKPEPEAAAEPEPEPEPEAVTEPLAVAEPEPEPDASPAAETVTEALATTEAVTAPEPEPAAAADDEYEDVATPSAPTTEPEAVTGTAAPVEEEPPEPPFPAAEAEEEPESALGDSTAAPDDDRSGEPATSAGSALGETPAAEKSAAVWRTEEAEPEASKEEDDSNDDDDGSEWQTWSGQAIEPPR